MYYLFIESKYDLDIIFESINQVNKDNQAIQFTSIKTNSVLPNCINIKTNIYNQLGIKAEIQKILDKIEYKGKFQLLKLLSRDHCLI